MSAVVIEYYAGVAGRAAASETAFAHRHETYAFAILTQWPDAADSEENIAWTRSLASSLEPCGSGAYLLNFVAADDDDRIRAALRTSYARLVEVKNRYDPKNFFRVSQNIKPTV